MTKVCPSFRASAVRLTFSSNRRGRHTKFVACILSIALVWSFLAGVAGATDNSWKGTTSASWSDGTNWSLGNPPGSVGGGDTVRFDNLSTTNLNTVNDIVGLSVAGIV